MSCVFCNISQRAMYGHLLAIADPPGDPAGARLQAVIKELWYALYDDPALLALPCFGDESYPWHMVNNVMPELDEKYRTVFKGVYEFWHFLQIISLSGEHSGNALFIDRDALKAGKAAYKPGFAPLLEKAGLYAKKEKTGVTLTCGDGEILSAMQKLATVAMERALPYEKHYVVNARSLYDFMRCSFDGAWEYMIDRIDAEENMGGALIALREECVRRGYALRMHPECCMASTSGFGIDFMRGVGGFHITYNPRKTQKFAFGTKNGIGEKKMLENLSGLDADLQRHFIDICRPCSGCMGCTKGGRNKMFTVKVEFEGAQHALCPMFPLHEWPAAGFTPELADRLFRYHELQEAYG